jgi:ABC-type transport system involved in multi-copper enzyme maturation permease subunit
MLWTIAKKELLEDLKSHRFTACFFLCLILFAVSSVVGARDYRNRLASVRAGEDQEEEELAGLRVYSYLRPTVYKRPSPLSVFSQGYERSLSPGVTVSHRRVPYLAQREKSDNAHLEIIPPMDLATVVKVVLSLLAILLSFDAISGEKEAGTLRLILANPLPRTTLLVGKYMGSMSTLAGALLTGFLLGAVVLLILSPVGIEGAHWLSLLFLLFTSGLYLSLFLVAGLLVSALTRKASTSLVILLSIWLFMVILGPNLSSFLASQIVERPSELERELEAAQVESQVEERVDRFAEALPSSKPMGELTVYGDDGEVLVRLGRPERYAWLTQYYGYMVSEWMRTADVVWERNREYLAKLKRQIEVGNALSKFSPAFLYESVCQVFCGTDLASYESFILQVREHRSQILDYVRGKQGYGTRRWFTDDPPSQEPFVLDPGSFDRSRMDMERGWRLIREAEADRSRILSLEDMPRFKFVPRSPGEALRFATPEIAILIVMNMFLFALYFLVFTRYDAR